MSDSTAITDSTAPATFTCARRQLLLGAGVGGVALAAAGCASSSKSSTATSPGGGSTAAGIIALSQVPTDSAVSVKADGRTLLITQSGGKLTALDATCTHMACTVGVAQDHLACPCHGSTYTLLGQVTQGPAPTALAAVAVKVVSGQVVLA